MKRLLFSLFLLLPNSASALSQSCPSGTPGLIDIYHDLWALCVDALKEERTNYLVCAAGVYMQDQIRGVAVSTPATFIVNMVVSGKIPQSALCNYTQAIANHQACEQTRALVASHRQACAAYLTYSEGVTGIQSW